METRLGTNMNSLRLSPLGHTWILDVDGTLLKHNGYLIDGVDSFLPGAEEFLRNIPEGDTVILLTSRKEPYRAMTEAFFTERGIRFNYLITEAPYGERILVNDSKPTGLHTSIGIELKRDEGIPFTVEIDPNL